MTDIYSEINKVFLNFNDTLRKSFIEKQPIIMLLIADNLVVYHYGIMRFQYSLDLTRYHKLKSVVHFCILFHNNDKEIEIKDNMRLHLRNEIVENKLDFQFIVNGNIVTVHKELLTAVNGNKLDKDALNLILKECADMFQQELHKQVQLIKNKFNNEEWNKIIIGVVGPPSPRPGHSALQYFERLVGSSNERGPGKNTLFEPTIENSEREYKKHRRLYYIENVDDVKSALNIIAQLEIEKQHYENILPMKTDILAYDSQKYLKKVCNK